MRAPSPYFDEHGSPQYAPSVVVYADALGIRTRAADRDALLDAYDAIEAHLVLGGEHEKTKFTRVQSFSDSTVLSEPQSEAVAEQLMRIVKQCGRYQLAHALCSHNPIRGAITIGDLFSDKRLTFGPALVEAVGLEEKTALYPRIVISPRARQALVPALGHADGFAWHDEIDDVTFVGYLAATKHIPTAAYESAHQVLELHKFRLETALSGAEAHQDKYRWSVAYHNAFVRRYWPERGDVAVQVSDPAVEQRADQVHPMEDRS